LWRDAGFQVAAPTFSSCECSPRLTVTCFDVFCRTAMVKPGLKSALPHAKKRLSQMDLRAIGGHRVPTLRLRNNDKPAALPAAHPP
jgi:hypothetical protein